MGEGGVPEVFNPWLGSTGVEEEEAVPAAAVPLPEPVTVPEELLAALPVVGFKVSELNPEAGLPLPVAGSPFFLWAPSPPSRTGL